MSDSRTSVIVIGRNEARHLEKTFASVRSAAGEFATPPEVVYVNSGSTDASRAIAEAHPFVRVVALERPPFSAARARNAGQRATTGSFVLFLDGDMTLAEGFVREALAAAARDPALAAVAGRLREVNARPSLYSSVMGLDWRSSPGPAATVGGAALWRRAALERTGGFDESLATGEDPDLSRRAVLAGFSLRVIDHAMADHDLDLGTFRDYVRRAVASGRSRGVVTRKHPGDAYARRRAREPVLHTTLSLAAVALALVFHPLAYVFIAAAVAVVLRRAWLDRRIAGSSALALAHAVHVYGVKPLVAWGVLTSRRAIRPSPTGPVAFLAPETPSVSATFVRRDVSAVESLGIATRVFSLHAPTLAGLGDIDRRFAERVDVLYGAPGRLAKDALRFAARHPVATVTVLRLVLRDLLRGSFAVPRQRRRLILQFIAALALAGRLVRERAVHLHVHFAHSPATVGMYAARLAGIPYSILGHANDLDVERSLLAEKITRSRAFFTISAAARADLIRSLGPIAESIVVVRCGTDVVAGPPRAIAPAARIVTVARLVAKKGIDVLLAAAAELRRGGTEFTLTIVGEGPERPGLESLADTLHLRDRVVFTGALPHEEALRLTRSADLFVLPCRVSKNGDKDGIPVALMEAMAAGVPVITTAVGGIVELVSDDESGVIVAPEDPSATADAVRRLLEDDALRTRLTTRARETIACRYSPVENARLWLAHAAVTSALHSQNETRAARRSRNESLVRPETPPLALRTTISDRHAPCEGRA